MPIVYSRAMQQRLLAVNRAKDTTDKLKAAVHGFSIGELKPSFPGVAEPRTGMSMGEHCELMAREWKISRVEQDTLALASHQKAAAAYERGFYKDLVVPFRGLDRDGFLRPDTSLEKLAALKPAFDKTSGQGTLTAGNSTGLSDGASAVLLASDEWAAARGLKPKAYLTHAKVAAVDFVRGEGLLMAPTVAVPRMLEAAGLTLQDFDFYEIHEAFAAQVLCTLRSWEDADYCKNRLGLAQAARIDRSGQAQRQRFEPRARSSVRGNGHAHRRHAGQAARGKRIGTRPHLDLHRGRHGRHGDSRTAMTKTARRISGAPWNGSEKPNGRRQPMRNILGLRALLM